MLADSHNHLHLFRHPAEVVRAMQTAGVIRCVVNATSEADWPEVARLAADFPGFILPAFGIHPWLALTATTGWEERLLDLLERHPAASVGECGLDHTRHAPPLATQTAVFETQLALARRLDRPATIHCVGAWGTLFDSFDHSPPPPRFLMHSFLGSPETAARLLTLGAFLSPPARTPEAATPKLAAAFRPIPPDRVLLETDAPGILPPADPAARPVPGPENDPAHLPQIARGMASLLGVSPAGLAAATLLNHQRCFAPRAPGATHHA